MTKRVHEYASTRQGMSKFQPKSNRIFSTDSTPGTPRNKPVRACVKDPRELFNQKYPKQDILDFIDVDKGGFMEYSPHKLYNKISEGGIQDGIHYDYKIETIYGTLYIQNPLKSQKFLNEFLNEFHKKTWELTYFGRELS